MNRLDSLLSRLEDSLATVSLALAAALAVASVVARFALGGGIFWAQEAVIFLVILSTFVGASITLRHNEHVNVDILPVLVGERGKWFFKLLASLLIVLYCGCIGGLGWLLITLPAANSTVTPALGLKLWIVEVSLPIGLTFMFIRSLEILYRTARGHQTFAEAEGNALDESLNEDQGSGGQR